jgi:hypothetical protein
MQVCGVQAVPAHGSNSSSNSDSSSSSLATAIALVVLFECYDHMTSACFLSSFVCVLMNTYCYTMNAMPVVVYLLKYNSMHFVDH